MDVPATLGVTIQEKAKPLPSRPPTAVMAEEFPGLGPSSGSLDLGKAANGKKNKKKTANNDNKVAAKKQPTEPVSLSSIADFLGEFFLSLVLGD